MECELHLKIGGERVMTLKETFGPLGEQGEGIQDLPVHFFIISCESVITKIRSLKRICWE